MSFIIKLLNYFYYKTGKEYNIGKIDGKKFIYRYETILDYMEHDVFGAMLESVVLFQRISFKVIVINNIYDHYDDDTKKFIIYHELGHKYLHLNENFDKEYITNEDTIRVENEVDEYVVKRLGWKTTHRALIKILNNTLINKPKNEVLVDSIKARIQYLEINKD